MKLVIAIMLTLCAVFGAGAASAKRLPHFVDADHRTAMIVPAAQGDLPLAAVTAHDEPAALIAGAGPLGPRADERKLPAQVPAHIAPVPEPSGIVMLGCGLLLLLAASSLGRSAVFRYTDRKLPSLPLK